MFSFHCGGSAFSRALLLHTARIITEKKNVVGKEALVFNESLHWRLE